MFGNDIKNVQQRKKSLRFVKKEPLKRQIRAWKTYHCQTCLEHVVSDQILCVFPTVRHTSSPEHGDEDLSLRPPSIGPSPRSSPALTPRLTHGSVMGTAEPEEGTSLSTQQALGSTEDPEAGRRRAAPQQLWVGKDHMRLSERGRRWGEQHHGKPNALHQRRGGAWRPSGQPGGLWGPFRLDQRGSTTPTGQPEGNPVLPEEPQ